MLTPYSHKQAARRAVHMAVGLVNIGLLLVPRPNVNPRYRSDSLLAVVTVATSPIFFIKESIVLLLQCYTAAAGPFQKLLYTQFFL